MQILLNLSDIEGLAITQAAKAAGLSRSEFIRRATRSALVSAGHAASGPDDSAIVPVIEATESEMKS